MHWWKNWTRDISECIKLLKCKLIQILKRSLNLRDCFSHFVLKNWYYRCLYFFLLLLFYPWATPQVPTVDQLKKNCFSLCEKTISQMSLYLPFTAISYKRLVTGSGKKKSTFWQNRQFAYALWMNKRRWESIYVVIEGSFSHRRPAYAV